MTFSKDDSIGEMDDDAILQYLIDIGDPSVADQIATTGATGQGMNRFGKRPWKHSDTMIGFIEAGRSGVIEVKPVIDIEADDTLRNRPLKITLDRFFVQEYPGGGQHKILCEFSGKNQVAGETEELRFATTCHANDGEGASVHGLPIFLGVQAGVNGISFQGRTINVESKLDNTILEVLSSDAFTEGLSLIDKVQPAIKPFAQLAAGVAKSVLTRSNNAQVHNFSLGLDFNGSQMSARLRKGSYLVVQVGSVSNWDWSLYQFDRSTLKLVPKSKDVAEPKWNYMLFGVSEYQV